MLSNLTPLFFFDRIGLVVGLSVFSGEKEVSTVAIEAIKKIKQIEVEGEKLVKEAEKKAVASIHQAKLEGEQTVGRAKEGVRTQVVSLKKKAEQEVSEQTELLQEQKKKTLKEMVRRAEKNLNGAVNLIIEKFKKEF
jgi:V/A-type H+-transporting ATPase subunit G/H